MSEIVYIPRGVCSNRIDVNVQDGIIKSASFQGGCNGNLKAISKHVSGMKAEDVIAMLEGNTCGPRSTSCADQLSCALREALD